VDIPFDIAELPHHDGPVLKLPTIWSCPTRPRDIDKAARDFSIPKDVQESVNRALEWLRIHQLADGSWEGDDRVAMTGLGLLTFLAHNEMTASARYGQTVERAVRCLLAASRDDGRFSENVYAHAIATYALAEAYGMLRIPELRPCLERGVQAILAGQQTGGSWDYFYRKQARRDTSVAGWQIQALKAARIAGVENSGIDDALARAAADLRGVQDAQTGRFAYSEAGQGGSDAMTGAGTLCLQLLGGIKEDATRRGIDAMRDFDCEWKDDAKWPLYTWYYVTQANFHYSKSTWERWKDRIVRTLVRNQAADGSWTAPGNETKHGPVYGTTLAALTLQVYSRCLPTYRETAVAAAASTEPEGPEVRLEVREM
jgi:hypothetical protein